jgi:hypothetical protein
LQQAFEGDEGMEAAAGEAAAEIAAMEQLRVGADGLEVTGLLASIGLLGRDLQAELSGARAAFSDGDLAAATRAAWQVVDGSSHAADAGRVRVAVAGGGVLLLDGIGMGILFNRRRQRQRLAVA